MNDYHSDPLEPGGDGVLAGATRVRAVCGGTIVRIQGDSAMAGNGSRVGSRRDPAVALLREKVRYAHEPDNPQLLRRWFELEDATFGTGVSDRWRLHVAQFRLLLDVFADDVLPAHWRTLCLDNIARPLAELSRLADDSERHRELQQLMRELRVVSHFFCPA